MRKNDRSAESDRRKNDRSAEPDRRVVRAGELLAIDPRALIKGSDAFFWMLGPVTPPVKRIGSTAIVYVRGALDHHADYCGGNYETILEDVRSAWEGDEENEPAERVVLAIDSPGGVVSGLYETVDALKKLAKGRPFHAYVEGLCASAAMALACSTQKIFCSASSIMGSVGVIATMYSQSRRDKALGIDIVTITSGARKADGHPHVAISSDAIKAERKRVMQFADQFFEIVEKARGFDPEPHEAALFVGKDAVKAGYADAIRTLETMQEKNVDYEFNSDTIEANDARAGVNGDIMRIKSLIKRTKKALAQAKTESEKARLRLDLAALQRAAALSAGNDTDREEEEMDDKYEGEEMPEEDDEDEAPEEDDEDEAPEEDDEDEAPEEDDEDEAPEEDDESEEDEKKAVVALGRLKLKGSSKKAIAVAKRALRKAIASKRAMRAELKGMRGLRNEVAAIRKESERRDLNATIDGALAAGRIKPSEAKMLRKQTAAEVGAFLRARPEPIVNRANLGADLKQSAALVSQRMNNFAPSQVTAEITSEMREAAEAIASRSNGKIKAEDVINDFLKETH